MGKLNGHRFPILACLARIVLVIPISSVALELIFSTSGRILDYFRTSLTPFMLEAIVCARDWIRRGTHIDNQESMEQLTTIERGKNSLISFVFAFVPFPWSIKPLFINCYLHVCILFIIELIEEFGSLHISKGKGKEKGGKNNATTSKPWSSS